MSNNYLATFKDFTTSRNNGFKLNINNIIVSVVCHNDADAIECMAEEKNGIIGKRLSKEFEHGTKNVFDVLPTDIPFFTFNNADICIFETDPSKDPDYHNDITDKFCDNTDGCIAPLHSAIDFIEICNKVLAYSKNRNI